MLLLKKTRESKNLSRYRLSKLSGVKESTIQSLENSNDPNPTFKTLCKLADALGVTLDELRREK